MEGIKTIIGYHTCKAKGTWKYIWQNTPFKSESNNRQWLTQGYYFWTDSDYFAHKWGQRSIKGDYAIIQCSIEIEKRLLLDLVGSVEDQLFFQNILNEFHKKLKLANPKAEAPTINAVISFYREQQNTIDGIFPFLAIKASDGYSEDRFKFIENSREFLILPTRQQLCLFEIALNFIKEKAPVFPERFKLEIG